MGDIADYLRPPAGTEMFAVVGGSPGGCFTVAVESTATDAFSDLSLSWALSPPMHLYGSGS